MASGDHASGAVALLLTRQALPILPRSNGLLRGAYVMQEAEAAQIQLIASGSEVSLALESAKALATNGIRARVVSMPSWSLFDQQEADYRASVIKPDLPSVVIEAGVAQGWHKYVGLNARFVTVETFGASAPYRDVFKHYGLTVEHVCAQAMSLF